MIWVCLILALVLASFFLYFYLPYRRAPEKRWRDAVVRSHRAAAARLATATSELRRLPQRHELEKQSLAQGALDLYLRGISVRELEAYPGIGPATVGRLEVGGYKNIASLRTARIRVKGLGVKRLADVKSAVGQLASQAAGRFQAGAWRESQELATRLKEIDTRYAELECRAQGRANGAADVLRQLEKASALARQITFWHYVRNDRAGVVSPEILQRPLPDLGAAIAAAEQAALQAHQSRTATDNSPPVLNAPSAVPSDRLVNPAPSSLQPSSASSANGVPNTPSAAETAETLLETTIAFAYAVARTDGSIAAKERAVIDEQFRGLYANDPALANRAKAFCAHYETAAIDVDASLRWIKERVPFPQREHLLKFACAIAEASGPMNQREIRLIDRTAREWGVPWTLPLTTPVMEAELVKPTAAPPAAAPQQSPISDPRTLLEIDPKVPLTADLIRRHFHLLSSRLNPDKAEAMGREFLEMALSKREAIRAAAEALMQPFGEPLELPDAPANSADLRHNPDLDAMFGV
ncbi:hypothetical protein AYO44_10820 [Planctomycetaceae bacterium SCGC AG-212-F19]|nr:hypothetical protein AYO44_10820 [Planctomycetaceae bacterium SCGC AG-212-F19]